MFYQNILWYGYGYMYSVAQMLLINMTKSKLEFQLEWLKEAELKLAELKASGATQAEINMAEYKVCHHLGIVHDMQGMSI